MKIDIRLFYHRLATYNNPNVPLWVLDMLYLIGCLLTARSLRMLRVDSSVHDVLRGSHA